MPVAAAIGPIAVNIELSMSVQPTNARPPTHSAIIPAVVGIVHISFRKFPHNGMSFCSIHSAVYIPLCAELTR